MKVGKLNKRSRRSTLNLNLFLVFLIPLILVLMTSFPLYFMVELLKKNIEKYMSDFWFLERLNYVSGGQLGKFPYLP